jgi:beta-catenin-like protein 1
VDYIVVDAAVSGAPSIKQRVHQILSLRKASIKTIRNIVREYAGNIGDQVPIQSIFVLRVFFIKYCHNSKFL